jgi:hypothetical protein
MVSNLSQYFPQGLASQFPGLQGAGWPQTSPGLFGQPGLGGGNVSFGQDFGQAGLNQQYPFGAQTNSSAQTPFTQNPFLQHPAQHLVAILGQLAQQLAAHGAMTQQVGIALHQLVQQLGAQSPQGYPGGIGAGQGFAGIGPPYAGVGGQYFGQNPFAGGYSGFNPQAQAWGANRPQTIQ